MEKPETCKCRKKTDLICWACRCSVCTDCITQDHHKLHQVGLYSEWFEQHCPPAPVLVCPLSHTLLSPQHDTIRLLNLEVFLLSAIDEYGRSVLASYSHGLTNGSRKNVTFAVNSSHTNESTKIAVTALTIPGTNIPVVPLEDDVSLLAQDIRRKLEKLSWAAAFQLNGKIHTNHLLNGYENSREGAAGGGGGGGNVSQFPSQSFNFKKTSNPILPSDNLGATIIPYNPMKTDPAIVESQFSQMIDIESGIVISKERTAKRYILTNQRLLLLILLGISLMVVIFLSANLDEDFTKPISHL